MASLTLKVWHVRVRSLKVNGIARNVERRVMTMRVLQIQLRSLTAMDIVAYGGAAAGIGVALWQYAHTTAAAAGASAAG